MKEFGSVVVLKAHFTNVSSCLWSSKEGVLALLYLSHVSIHLDHLKACVLKKILDLSVLEGIVDTLFLYIIFVGIELTFHKVLPLNQEFQFPHFH